MKTFILICIFLFLLNCKQNQSDYLTITENDIQKQTKLYLNTDKNSYTTTENIIFTIYNHTDSTVYLSFCGPNLILICDKKINDNWIIYSATICLAIYSFDNMGFIAGEEVKASRSVGNIGIYRLRIPYSMTDSYILSDTLVSNEFIVD